MTTFGGLLPGVWFRRLRRRFVGDGETFEDGGGNGFEFGGGAAASQHQGLGGDTTASAPAQGQSPSCDAAGGQEITASAPAQGQSPSCDAAGGQESRWQSQSLTPVTIRILKDALNEHRGGQFAGCPDAEYCMNGQFLGMITFVACVESVQQQPMYIDYCANDGSGRISVRKHVDGEEGQHSWHDVRAGEYVRIFCRLREWQGKDSVTAHKIVRIDSANEISYHTTEVAHVHLSVIGKLIKSPPVVGVCAAPGVPLAADQLDASAAWGTSLPGPFGAAPTGDVAGTGSTFRSTASAAVGPGAPLQQQHLPANRGVASGSPTPAVGIGAPASGPPVGNSCDSIGSYGSMRGPAGSPAGGYGGVSAARPPVSRSGPYGASSAPHGPLDGNGGGSIGARLGGA